VCNIQYAYPSSYYEYLTTSLIQYLPQTTSILRNYVLNMINNNLESDKRCLIYTCVNICICMWTSHVTWSKICNSSLFAIKFASKGISNFFLCSCSFYLYFNFQHVHSSQSNIKWMMVLEHKPKTTVIKGIECVESTLERKLQSN